MWSTGASSRAELFYWNILFNILYIGGTEFHCVRTSIQVIL